MNSKLAKWGALAATILPTLAFIMAGGMKLSGAPEMVASFQKFGLPVAFMYFIGACEVAGAIGLWLNFSVIVQWSLRRLAALGLSIIMAGAIAMHALHDPLVTALPAAVLLALLVFLFRKFGVADESVVAQEV